MRLKSFAILLPLLLLSLRLSAATAYNEFYCMSTGTNINAGSTTGAVTYTSTNAAWSTVTGLFTPADGTTPASTVSSGMWASVYIDAATVGVYIGRITNVAAGANGAISVDQSTGAGTPPTTSANTRTIRVGGAWFGPNAASGFPLNLTTLLRLTNGINKPRINFKNDASYKITAAINCAASGPYLIQGYTTTPGDGGRATLDGNTVATAFTALTIGGALTYLGDFIISSNGNSSSAIGLVSSGSAQIVERVTVANMRGNGFSIQGTGGTFTECEAYGNGVANTALNAGIALANSTTSTLLRCNSHDNTAANIAGFHLSGSGTLIGCISDSNGTNGYTIPAITGTLSLSGCESYNNGGHGFEIKALNTSAITLYIENCNFVKNALWGMSSLANGTNMVGAVQYCGFGSGTQANGSGTVTTTGWGGIDIRDSTFITYAANTTPWLDPANGDFRISNNQSWGVGRGSFTESQASYSGTIGYPDIGAAQHRGITNAVGAASAQ